MTKRIDFLVRSTPTNPELGFFDLVQVFEDENNIYGGHGSTCPNPYKINKSEDPEKTSPVLIPWFKLYGWIAECSVNWECIEHPKYGKCILLNHGQSVPSRVPNPTHEGKKIIAECFIHSGALGSINKRWRGSRGCLTIPPEDWEFFISLFSIGEKGKLNIKPYISAK